MMPEKPPIFQKKGISGSPQELLQQGMMLQQAGCLEQAIYCYRQFLTLEPSRVDVEAQLGTLLHQLGHAEAAIPHYQRALKVDPEHADLLCQLGSALHNLDRLSEALPLYKRVLAIQPDNLGALCNLSLILQERGQLDEAIKGYRHALSHHPDHPDLLNNLGRALHEQGHADQALALYQQGLSLAPQHLELLTNLGRTLETLNQMEASEQAYRAVLTLQPNEVTVWNNLGGVLQHQARMEEALACYRQALEIQPDHHAALSNLLVTIPFLSQWDAASVASETRRIGALLETPFQPQAARPHENTPDPERPLHIGFLSPSLAKHVLAPYLEPVLAALDRKRFRLFVYAHTPHADEVTRRLMTHVQHWHFVHRLSDDQVAAQIRADAIDILIDPMGHWADNRLLVFARKPAPIQISYLCQGISTGLSSMDYIFGDRWLNEGGSMADHAVEKVIELPSGFQVTSLDQTPTIEDPPYLKKGHITFGAFTNPAKISDASLALWASVMQAVPTARLLIKGKFLESNAIAARLRYRAAQFGVDEQRLDIVGLVAESDYLSIYKRVDMVLDTTPFTGGRTTVEALWMGVPVLTLKGEAVYGRYSASHLNRIGADELIAECEADFVEMAVALATDSKRLQRYRQELRKMLQDSSLINPVQHVMELEQTFRHLWKTWCRGRRIKDHKDIFNQHTRSAKTSGLV